MRKSSRKQDEERERIKLDDGAPEFFHLHSSGGSAGEESACIDPSRLTREDLSRFLSPCLLEYIPFIHLTSPVYLSTLAKSTSNPSARSPKPARRRDPVCEGLAKPPCTCTPLYGSTYL